MEGSNYAWSTETNRISNTNSNASSSSNSSLYTRLAQNLSRSHGPLILGRAQEGSRLIRNNINSVINELGPLMYHPTSRDSGNLNLRSWIRRQHQPDGNSRFNMPSTSESTIIDFGNSTEPISPVSEPIRTNPQQYSFSSSETANILDHGNNDNYINEQHDHTNDNHNSNPNNSNINNNNSNPSNNNNNNNSSSSITISTNSDDNTHTEESNPDTQSIVTFFHKYIPFVLILLCKAIYDHRTGILIFLGLLVTFAHADSIVKREIAKQSRRSLFSLSILFINLFFCICFIYYVFQDQHLYKCLILIPAYSQPLSLWDLLWIVGITDFVLKFITIQIKVGMACFPARLLPYSARGKWYLFLECVSQFYRGLVPIQPWLYYLLESYQGPEKVIGVSLSAAYMISKGTDLMSKFKLFKTAFWKLLQNVSLGVSPSKEELDTAGSQCPICHDDYETPVLLNCRHVFCEACVTTWFDREQTCPLCRTKVADDPTWKDGATTFFAQLF